MRRAICDRAAELLQRSIVWDNHACMPLRPEDDTFLPQLARSKAAGVTLVSLNVAFDMCAPGAAVPMLAAFRHWIAHHSEDE